MSHTCTTHRELDANYNWHTVVSPRRAADLLIQATKCDNRATEWEVSADRWAAKGISDAAARNLQCAKEEREQAARLRRQAAEVE